MEQQTMPKHQMTLVFYLYLCPFTGEEIYGSTHFFGINLDVPLDIAPVLFKECDLIDILEVIEI